MATEKWIAGAVSSWTAAFAGTSGADLNSLANGSSILSSVTISNGSVGDIYADLSIAIGSLTAAAPNYIGAYVYPLNEDGSTYGDSQLTAGTQAAKLPGGIYWARNFPFPTGTAAITGTILRITIPFGTFKFCLYNQSGASFPSSGNSCQYRTVNRQIV